MSTAIVVRLLGDAKDFTSTLTQAQTRTEKFKAAVGKAALAAGGAAGAALSVGLAGALDAEDQLAKFRASAGDAKWAKAAGDAAGRLYGNAYGESVGEVASGVSGLFREGLLSDDATGEQIDAVAAKALSLAQVFDQDVASVARAAGQMIKTGLAENATEAFDVLTRGFQEGANKSDDLLDTFNEYGVQFKKLGLDGAAATGLLSQGLQGGARDSDLVADALKEFTLRTAEAADGTIAAQAGFEGLGLSAEGMSKELAAGGPRATKALDTIVDRLRAVKDPAKRSALAVELFGTQAEDLGDALFSLDPSTATKGLGEIAGAAAKVDETIGGTTNAAVTAFTRQVKQELTNAVAGAIPYIQGVVNAVRPFAPLIIPLVGILAGFAAVVWTVTAATKAYAAAQAAAVIVSNVWRVATTNLRLAQIALSLVPGPLLIIAGIVALVAIFVVAYKKVGWFRDGVQAAFRAVTGAVRATIGWVRDNWPKLLAIITGPIGLAVLAVTKNWNAIKSGASKMKDGIVSALSGLADVITAPFRAAFNGIASAWNNTVGRLSFTVPGWVPGIGGNGWDVPDIPMLARGGRITAPGWAMVGERGPELLNLGRGAQVVPLDRAGGDESFTVELHGNGVSLEGLIEKVVVRRDRAMIRTARAGGVRTAVA